MLLFKKFRVFPLLFFVFFGCRKPTSANWDVDVVLPLVNSSLNIKNFIGDTIFTTDNTGLLHLQLDREILSLKLDSLLNLPDTTFPVKFPIPFFVNTLINPGEPVSGLPPSDLEFKIGNGVELKRVDIHKGSLTIKFSNEVTQPLDLIYKIPNVQKYGLPLVITETIPTGNNSLEKSYDLSGYSMNLTGEHGDKYNTVVQTYTIGVSASGSTVYVNSTQNVKIDVSYSEIIPEYVEGYFGKQVVDIPLDTAKIGLIKNVKANNFKLSDATMNFKVLNEFGVEFSGNLSNIRSINSTHGNVVALNSNQFASINIDAATKTGNSIHPGIRPILLNSTNSNITDFISNLPDKLTYKGRVSLNTTGDNSSISGHHDFAFYNTGIRIIANIDIPMRFTANYFQLKSNPPINFSSVSQLDNVNSGNFVISASNGYPFDAKLQAYMMDENNLVIDSMFISGANTLEKGQLNSQNDVTFPTRSRISVPVTRDKIQKLQKCKSIQVVSTFVLPAGPPDIKIYENYVFDVNIVAEVNYNVGIKN